MTRMPKTNEPLRTAIPNGSNSKQPNDEKGMSNMAQITLTPDNINLGAAVMSSREIAKVCDKRHDHILRDIEKMLRDIDAPKSGAVDIDGSRFGPRDFQHTYQDAKGELRKEYRLPKDLTLTLISGYNADLRFKIIKRLEQLEEEKRSGGFKIPKTLSEALRLAAVQSDQIEEMRLDVEAHARIVKADGSLCARDAAKVLQIRQIDLTKFLSHNGWTYKQAQNGPWLGYQSKITLGLLEHKVTTIDRSDGSEKIVTQCRVTPKGLSKLAKLIPTAVVEVAS